MVDVLLCLIENGLGQNLWEALERFIDFIFFILVVFLLPAQSLCEETFVEHCFAVDVWIVISNQHRLLCDFADLKHVEDL